MADDNWLPPDNIQQNPSLVIASRTSPTNIGMALLADLAAYDFGYVLRRAVPDAHAAHFRHAVSHGTLSGAFL